MKTEEIKEILDAVMGINEVLYDQTRSEYYRVELQTDGICSIVTFGGYVLWSSEDDTRGVDMETGEYRSMEAYLYKGIKILLKTLTNMALIQELKEGEIEE